MPLNNALSKLPGSIEMVWRALRYPSRGHALLIVLAFALLFWVGTASLFGLVASIIAISWPMKYAYHILERTAFGHFDPPQMTAELVNPVSQQPLRHLAVLAALFSLCYWTNSLLGGFLSAMLLAAGLISQPAVAAVIALDGRLLAPLEPRVLMDIVRELGVDYALVGGLLLVLGMLIFMVAPYMPRGITYALVLYGMFACFHLLGLALYQHRQQLGIEADVSPERELEERRDYNRRRLNKLLDEAYRLASGNRNKAAADLLISTLSREGDTIDDHYYIHEQTRAWPEPFVALRHGQVLITRLWRAQDLPAAVEVYAHLQRLSNDFRLENAAEVLPLARCAQSLRKSFVAAHMLRNFEYRFPEHPDCGAVVRLRSQLQQAE
ncbi:MAG: hypothetical protein U1F34_02730 [Gammaproteobacteria bacterium]